MLGSSESCLEKDQTLISQQTKQPKPQKSGIFNYTRSKQFFPHSHFQILFFKFPISMFNSQFPFLNSISYFSFQFYLHILSSTSLPQLFYELYPWKTALVEAEFILNKQSYSFQSV